MNDNIKQSKTQRTEETILKHVPEEFVPTIHTWLLQFGNIKKATLFIQCENIYTDNCQNTQLSSTHINES